MIIFSAITVNSKRSISHFKHAKTIVDRVAIITQKIFFDSLAEDVGPYLEQHIEWLATAAIKKTKYGFKIVGPGMQINFYDKDKVNYKPYGVIYGFPACCRDYFDKRCFMIDTYKINDLDMIPNAKDFDGTGYIPCHRCRVEPSANKIEEINANRLIPQGFPNGELVDNYILAEWLVKNGEPVGKNITDALMGQPECKHSLLQEE